MLLSHLDKFPIIPLTLSVTFGHSFTNFMTSLVEGLFMPIIVLIFEESSWQNLTYSIVGVDIKFGELLADGLNLICLSIILLFIFNLVEKKRDG